DVHRLFGHNVLELTILLLQLPQPPCLAQLQPAELALPSVETRPRDPVPTAQLSRFHPSFRLLQDGDDLIFAESTLSHNSSSGPGGPSYYGRSHISNGLFSGGQVNPSVPSWPWMWRFLWSLIRQIS